MADKSTKMQPHSVEAEQSVLGALMIDAKASARITQILRPADFYRADHRLIAGAIAALQQNGSDVDPVTVSDLLDRKGTLDDAGGLGYIGRLAKETPTAANIETYAAIVRDRSMLRQLKAVVDNVSSETNSGSASAAEIIANVQEQLQRLQGTARTGNGLIDSRQLVAEFANDLDARSAGSSKGLQIGLPDFDELTCGLEAGDLVVIAARPGVGKTALLVSIASTTSSTTPAAIFSAEMPSHQLMRRCVALHSHIAQGALRRPERLTDENWAAIAAAQTSIGDRKLWIDDTGSPTLAHIRAETLALKSRVPLGLVLIDYVQLVRALGRNRYEELRDVSYGLKALAKELALPIIVLAQLNRGVESREAKRPNASDLRDSGAIEEAADIVGLLYSEAHYDPSFQMPYVLECQIAKNRNGERGNCLWRFEGAYSSVEPLDSGSTLNYRRLLADRTKSSSGRDNDL